MKYFEFTKPYFAIIKGESKEEAIKAYKLTTKRKPTTYRELTRDMTLLALAAETAELDVFGNICIYVDEILSMIDEAEDVILVDEVFLGGDV